MLGQLQVDPNGPSPAAQELERLGAPEPIPPSELYWAARDAGEVIAELNTKEKAYFDYAEQRGFTPMWRHMTGQYYGQDAMTGEWVTQIVSTDGELGELVRFRVNETRSFMKQLMTMAIGTRPAFECSATNNDYDSIGQAETADAIIEYVYQSKYGERKERRTLEKAMLAGTGWSWCNWDSQGGASIDVPVMRTLPDGTQQPAIDVKTGQPVMRKEKTGDLVLKSLGPWDVVSEPEVEESDDHLWRLVRERRSKWEVAGKFKDLRKQILAISGVDNFTIDSLLRTDARRLGTDEITVKHFYHAPTPAMDGTKYADGRYLMYVGDVALIDVTLPYSQIPLVDLCPAEFIGSSFGYSDAWDLCSINQMADQIISDVASNLSAFGRQCISVVDGTDVNASDLANGMKVLTRRPGTDKPEALMLAAIPAGAQWFLDLLGKKYQSISALNSVTRGDPSSNITSGQMAALFHSIAIECNSALQQAVDTHRERLANLILDILKQYANHPMIVRIAGADERPYLDTFTRDKLLGVRGVLMKTSNPMMRTNAGRLQYAELAMKIPGAVTDPAQINEIFVSGQAKPLYDASRKRRMRIKLEDELLLKGPPVLEQTEPALPPLPNGVQPPQKPPYKVVQGVPVHLLDDHEKHIDQHYALLASRDVLQNQALWDTVNAHIQHHIKVWREADPAVLIAAGLKPFPQVAPPAPPAPPAGAMPRIGQPGAPANDNGGSAGAGKTPEAMRPTDQPMQAQESLGVPLPKPAKSPIPANGAR